MDQLRETQRKTIQEVVRGSLDRRAAAEILGVSPKTIKRYVKKFLDQGPEGLLDRRHGNFHRLGAEHIARIVALKQEKPHRSAQWLLNNLKLPVSVEAVRMVLVKHHLNRMSRRVWNRSSA